MSHFAIATIASLIAGVSALTANMISFAMIGRINERVPENERISYFRWGMEVRQRFNQLYPSSKLSLVLNLCIILMLVSCVLGIRFWVFS